MKFLTEVPTTTSRCTVEVTGVLLDEVQNLQPGQVLKLSGRAGRHIAILDWEDLEHIMGQAMMAGVPNNGGTEHG